MRAAPQYWIHNAAGFGHASVARYFAGFAEHLLDVFGGRVDGVTDMRAVLERIEELAPGTATGPKKAMMVAIYALWHRVVVPEQHRQDAQRFLARWGSELEAPGLVAFAAAVLGGEVPGWPVDAWVEIATARHAERLSAGHVEVPAVIDAALQVVAAERLVTDGRRAEAVAFAAQAVEEMPGNALLLEWERALGAGEDVDLDLGVLFGLVQRGE
jgi:hypothetical protein